MIGLPDSLRGLGDREISWSRSASCGGNGKGIGEWEAYVHVDFPAEKFS